MERCCSTDLTTKPTATGMHRQRHRWSRDALENQIISGLRRRIGAACRIARTIFEPRIPISLNSCRSSPRQHQARALRHPIAREHRQMRQRFPRQTSATIPGRPRHGRRHERSRDLITHRLDEYLDPQRLTPLSTVTGLVRPHNRSRTARIAFQTTALEYNFPLSTKTFIHMEQRTTVPGLLRSRRQAFLSRR